MGHDAGTLDLKRRVANMHAVPAFQNELAHALELFHVLPAANVEWFRIVA